MPFLGRRAIENKSLMSGDEGAAAERGRIWREMKRRWFGVGGRD
jgi:proline dehydrogenase